ncbi:hypothetical protein GKD14_14185 [Paeniclostridium sordellii]|nr:hypothetical protein [Paeniclostridium sordellii]MSB60094.1 hypothetical protein [Paeniclostridium sordellii]
MKLCCSYSISRKHFASCRFRWDNS